MLLLCYSGSAQGDWIQCSEHHRQQHCTELDQCNWSIWIPAVLETYIRSEALKKHIYRQTAPSFTRMTFNV